MEEKDLKLTDSTYEGLPAPEALKCILVEALLGNSPKDLTLLWKIKKVEDVLANVEQGKKIEMLGQAVIEAINFGKTLDITRDFVRKTLKNL